MSQYSVILKAMINNRDKKTWTAKDFQKAPYFVGYEATARMSELYNTYPELFKKGLDGRFRTLEINWECPDIKYFIKEYGVKSEKNKRFMPKMFRVSKIRD